jgi:protein-tyrosine phosphatase
MIDLHNHILPCIDDGARDLEEALTMARQAIAQGTTVMAATPHRFHSGREHLGPFIEKAVAGLQLHLDKKKIPLKIVPGVELPMRPDTAQMLVSGALIPLGGAGGKYVLVEPPFDRIPSTALRLLESILDLGLIAIIAHPERNSEVQKSLAFLDTCAALGLPIQITAGSIVGKFGPRPQRCAKEIAAHLDWRVFISSDAHDAFDRTPGHMREAVETVADWIGDEAAARRMVDEIPRGLLP